MFPLGGPPHSHEMENFPCSSPPHSPEVKKSCGSPSLSIVPGKGRDLNCELPNQLQRAFIHLYSWSKFCHQSTSMRLGPHLGVSFTQEVFACWLSLSEHSCLKPCPVWCDVMCFLVSDSSILES